MSSKLDEYSNPLGMALPVLLPPTIARYSRNPVHMVSLNTSDRLVWDANPLQTEKIPEVSTDLNKPALSRASLQFKMHQNARLPKCTPVRPQEI